MARVLSVKERHEVALEGRRYWLRTPTLYDKPRLRRMLRARGLRPVGEAEMERVLRQGVAAIGEAAGDAAEAERLAGVLDDFARLKAAVGRIDPAHLAPGDEETRAEMARLGDLAREVEEIERAVERHYPPYRALLADHDEAREVMPFEACRLLLVEAEGLDPPLGSVAPEGLSEAQLGRLGEAHALAVGMKGLTLFGPTEGQEKN